MAVKSGIPTTINGVQVGATDFSEFTVGAGLPAGITGLSANFAPLTVGIKDTPVSPSFTEEGKYFEIETPITFNAPWAFVIDAFNGLIEQGELLARISTNFSTTQNRRCMGPGMSLQLNPGISGAGSSIQDAFSSGDVEVSGGRFVNGGVANIDFFSISQALQEDDWIWMRIRKTNNAGIPSNDDWTVTAWYGDIEDEPAAPDGVSLNNSDGTPRGLFGIGCTYLTPGSSFTQRVAFLSYSENPDAVPPPIPPLGAATIWTPFPEVFAQGLPKPTILGPEMEYDVRVLTLNDGDTVDSWPDTSGQGNNIAGGNDPSFIEDGWSPGINAVRLQDVVGDLQEVFLSLDTSGFLNTDVTFFAVFQIDDLSDGAAILGNRISLAPPRIYNLGVDIDGSIFFDKSFSPRNIVSAPGTIEEGVKYVVTARMSGSTGMIVRVNGILVGSADDNDSKLEIVEWDGDSRIGQSQVIASPGGEFGFDKLLVWLAGYSVAASDEQIVQMESFLSGVFQTPFGTVWTDQPEVSPGTVWANIP